VDNWGQSVTDGTHLYAVNDSHVDGPGIYVGAYDATAKQLWAVNKYGMCRIDAGDIAGGIAFDGGTLFYGPSYSPGMGVTLGFASGVYAFDPAMGTKKWFVAGTPQSGISAGGGLVYLIESGKLTALKQTDGSMVWSAAVMGAGTQAPVLGSGKVVVATTQAVSAFDAATGKPAWSTPIAGAAAQAFNLMFSGGCVPGSGQWSGNEFGTAVATTTLAAALGSDTLVVTAADGVHVLSLSTGTSTWSGMPAQAMGTVKNPTIVGKTVYVTDSGALLSLQGT
jgi:outer membrane protein assembly factor BamB